MKKLIGRALVVVGIVLALSGAWMYLSGSQEDIQWDSGMGGAGNRTFLSLEERDREAIIKLFSADAEDINRLNAERRNRGMILTIVGATTLFTGLVMLATPRKTVQTDRVNALSRS